MSSKWRTVKEVRRDEEEEEEEGSHGSQIRGEGFFYHCLRTPADPCMQPLVLL